MKSPDVIQVKKTPPSFNEVNNVRREDIFYPSMGETSQITSKSNKYPLLKENKSVDRNEYREKYEPMMGDKDYVPPKILSREEEKLKTIQKIIEKELEQKLKMLRRTDIIYGSDEEYYKKFPHKNYKQFDGNLTGGAADIVTDEIAGVKKGEEKPVEDVINGVNPNYSSIGNVTYKTNCQASVVVLDARTRGYDIEVSITYYSEIKTKLSFRPNIAYIDPKTGKTPEFTKIPAQNENECETWLNNNIKRGEKHILAFYWKQKSFNNQPTGHVLLVTKNKDNKLVFYDGQNKAKYNDANYILHLMKYQFDWNEEKNPPKILRVDDKEFNKNILNQISKPSVIRNN